jgi:hypothetical protein
MANWRNGYKGLAAYLKNSKETAERYVKNGIITRFVRLPSGSLLFREDWVDADLERFMVTGADDRQRLDGIVDDIMRDL